MRPVGNDARSRPDSRATAQTSLVVRLGGPIFTDTNDPAEMARAHRRLGYNAAYCPKVECEGHRGG